MSFGGTFNFGASPSNGQLVVFGFQQQGQQAPSQQSTNTPSLKMPFIIRVMHNGVMINVVMPVDQPVITYAVDAFLLIELLDELMQNKLVVDATFNLVNTMVAQFVNHQPPATPKNGFTFGAPVPSTPRAFGVTTGLFGSGGALQA